MLLTVTSCLEPYQPDLEFPTQSSLVVNGFIDAAAGTATVTLTRAQAVQDIGTPPAVNGAMISITGSEGTDIDLAEVSPGNYLVNNFPVNFAEHYTLHISTPDGKTYESDQVRPRKTPAIDSVTYDLAPSGNALDIMVSANDLFGDSKYFIWSFEETWSYTARYFSNFKLVNRMPVARTPAEYVFTCYRTRQSSNILLATNEKLSLPVISEFVLNSIPKGSEKITSKYSVVVTQRVLSPEEFEFQTNLRNTTENLGGLFDPMPNPVTGNIHEVNQPDSPVLGYFAAGEEVKKRIFIELDDVPESIRTDGSQVDCPDVLTTCSIAGAPVPPCEAITDLLPANVVILEDIYNRGLGIVDRWTYITIGCGDCRNQGGVTTRPQFWPSNWH
jgi:hypothetical protein